MASGPTCENRVWDGWDGGAESRSDLSEALLSAHVEAMSGNPSSDTVNRPQWTLTAPIRDGAAATPVTRL